MLSRTARPALPMFLAGILVACGGGGGDGGGPAATTSVYATPVAVNTSLAFTRVESSGQHACGIATDGSTWCWGHDDNGQLGVAVSPGTCNGSPCSAMPV
ncbi:MAG: RCC1 domain-containing protein, partial [Caldimonas sp.]